MKRAIVLIACMSLLGTACGDSDDESSRSSSSAPVASAALTPEVLCQRFDGAVFFGYVNDASVPVRLSAEQSVLEGGLADDNPYVPTLFAPGRVAPAFYAFAGDADIPLAWTVTGVDGVTRAASLDAASPECTDTLLTRTTADPRLPSIEITGTTVSTDGTSVTIEASVVGVPEQSVCNQSFTAHPVVITMDDGNGGGTVQGSALTASSELFTWQGKPGLNAAFTVAALVIDDCGSPDDPQTQRSWPGGEFENMRNGLTVCVSVVDEVVATGSFYGGLCGDLPPTGGARTRPG